MVTYDDVETMNRGRQAQVEDLSKNMIDQYSGELNRKNIEEEEKVKAEISDSLRSDALTVIEQMDAMAESNNDPMEIYNQLPPPLQATVSKLIQERESTEGVPNSQEVVDREDVPNSNIPVVGSGQGEQQQSNGNITDTAKKLIDF